MSPIEHRLFAQPWPEGDYRFFQLGFVVDDLLGSAARWAEVFGVGPFHVLPVTKAPCTYKGTETVVEMQVAVAQAGPVQVELIMQISDGPSVYRDVYAAGSGGFHQLCTVAPDYDATRAHHERLGHELTCEFGTTGSRVGYFDTFAEFGFYTEVLEEVPGFLEQVGAISRTCAEWDGTDPVRLLTRGGYRLPDAL